MICVRSDQILNFCGYVGKVIGKRAKKDLKHHSLSMKGLY